LNDELRVSAWNFGVVGNGDVDGNGSSLHGGISPPSYATKMSIESPEESLPSVGPSSEDLGPWVANAVGGRCSAPLRNGAEAPCHGV
jgi:hypothetical protein